MSQQQQQQEAEEPIRYGGPAPAGSSGGTKEGNKGIMNAGLYADPDDHAEDQICFMRTLRAFREYSRYASDVVNLRRQDFSKLSPQHKQLLGFDPEEKIYSRQKECIQANQKLLDDMCGCGMELFQNYWPRGPVIDLKQPPPKPTSVEVDKVFSTLRQLVRDWGSEGEYEREIMMKPIRQVLEVTYPNPQIRGDVRVMVPGSGLNRTTLDLCLMGFAAQGNEFSYHMLIAGHFILNHVQTKDTYQIFPFCDQSTNLLKREDQFRSVGIPYKSTFEAIDELQSEQGIEFGSMSMVAGDFIDVYSKPEHLRAWDCIVTAFFIDTAQNIMTYLTTMYDALAPGGQWINLGPLMWHWSNDLSECSIDLSCDEVLDVARRVGFVVDESSIKMIDSPYDGNKTSMKQMYYQCCFWVATKPMDNDVKNNIKNSSSQNDGHSSSNRESSNVNWGSTEVAAGGPPPPIG